MLSLDKNWMIALVTASLAVAFAAAGLALTAIDPGASPLVAFALLSVSLGCTVAAFAQLAIRLRRLELENEGLIEEISQTFDGVKDTLAKLQDSVGPIREAPEPDAGVRRVVVK